MLNKSGYNVELKNKILKALIYHMFFKYIAISMN